jgi:hypothetical protein
MYREIRVISNRECIDPGTGGLGEELLEKHINAGNRKLHDAMSNLGQLVVQASDFRMTVYSLACVVIIDKLSKHLISLAGHAVLKNADRGETRAFWNLH